MVVATKESFSTEVIEKSHDKPVLVDFWADWCNPCKIIAPILEELEEEFNNQFILVKINIENEPDLATEFQIRSIPNLLLFFGGEPVNQVAGTIPKESLKSFLQPWILDEQSRLIKESVQKKDWSKAKSFFEKAETISPSLLPELWQTIQAVIIDKNSQAEPEKLSDFIKKYPTAGAPQSQLRQALVDLINQEGVEALDCVTLFFKSDEFLIRNQLNSYLKEFSETTGSAKETIRKKTLVAFQILGNANPLTIEYRKQLAKLIY